MLRDFLLGFQAYPVLWAPIISLFVYLVFRILRLTLKAREKKNPGSVKEEKMTRIKTCTKVFGIIAILTWVLIIGGYLLLCLAVRNM